MNEKILQKFLQSIFVPKLRKAESKIGYRLVFPAIPNRYINGWVGWDETSTWKKFGLNLEVGANYWTMGKVVNGVSSRFNRNAPEYQSWLGGYVVKLASKQAWTVEDHFKLAIADQNSWLNTYGDPSPLTTIEGWEFTPVGEIRIGGQSGNLYEGGCTTHSDVGKGYKTIKLRLASIGMAALFNSSNPSLRLRRGALRPKASVNSYETLKLRGYIAIFDLEENVKVVLYGNGAVVPKKNGDTDTFITLKSDLLKAIQSCDIVKT